MKARKDMPPKLYRNLLKKNYQDSHREYQKIKNYINKITNPILQKEDRFIHPRTKGNALFQDYLKRVAEKPEKLHIKKFSIKNNISNCATVVTEPNQPRGKKMDTGKKNMAHSVEKRNRKKQICPKSDNDNNNNLIFDALKSVQENQKELFLLRNKVSIILLFILLKNIIEKISI